MATKINGYKITKKESVLHILDDTAGDGSGKVIDGDVSGLSMISGSTITTTGDAKVANILKGGFNGVDNTIIQYDDTEVARIHDGGVVPSVAGTSTSLSAGTGFGYRRRVITVDSSNDNNVLTLTAADSGAIIYVFATNALNINLPVVGTEIGQFFTIILGDKDNKALTITCGGADDNDNIILQNTATVAENAAGTTADLGGADHDVLTRTNMFEGSRVDLLNFVGGANELWLANVISTDTVAATIA